MRLALGLLVLVLAVPAASAQSRFQAECLSSTEGEGALPAEVAQTVCSCTETAALAAGETAASLDRFIAYTESASLSPDEPAPEWAVTTSGVLMQGLMGCMLQAQMAMGAMELVPEGPDTASAAPTSGKAAAEAPPQGPAPVAAPPPPAAPTGLRTGNGTGPVRTQQVGTGAAVRIVG